VKLQTSTNFN